MNTHSRDISSSIVLSIEFDRTVVFFVRWRDAFNLFTGHYKRNSLKNEGIITMSNMLNEQTSFVSTTTILFKHTYRVNLCVHQYGYFGMVWLVFMCTPVN